MHSHRKDLVRICRGAEKFACLEAAERDSEHTFACIFSQSFCDVLMIYLFDREAEKLMCLKAAERDLIARGISPRVCPGCGDRGDAGCSCCPYVVSPAGYTKTGDGKACTRRLSFDQH